MIQFCHSIEELQKKADEIRATCIKMAYKCQESHLSSALSCVEILTVLFGNWLRHPEPCGNQDKHRDRFILSKGHGCSALYATMASFGMIPAETLRSYSQSGSSLPNHPCKHAFPKLEISSGSLGHGLGIAAGMLYGTRLEGLSNIRAAVLMGDGECNEGSVWEAAMFAAAQKLNNLVAIVDNNGTQAVGRNDALTGFTSLEEKFESFGWEAITVEGNNIETFHNALQSLPLSQDKPSAIIAKTTSGAGVSFIENEQFWFYRRPDKNDLDNALSEINEPPLI